MSDIKFTKPSSMSKTLEIKDERDNTDNTWRVCCSNTDHRCIEFSAKLGISGIALLFGMIQIFRNTNDCNPLISFYSSLITLVVGYWVPAPKLKKKE